MRAALVLLSLGLLTGSGHAQSAISEFRWDELQKQGRLSGGTVLPSDAESPFPHLQVKNEVPAAASVTVLTIDRPSVPGQRYAVTGQVRYDGVEAISYLELWNHFPDGSQYFSRTLGEVGPMQRLKNSSGWRAFALPFDATRASAPPSRLVLNVVLAGRGRVELGPLNLVGAAQSGRLDDAQASWTDRLSALAGGLGGGLVGGLGALVGVFTSLGRARRFVIALTLGLVTFGAILLVAGLVAAGQARPYAVFYPLLLLGLVASVVPLVLLPTIRRRYAEIELRMMRAHDIA